MDTPRENPDVQQEQIPKFRGLYRHVKISVKSLDRIIFACIAVIVITVALDLISPGFNVKFDSRGGTDVAAQTELMYGDHVLQPEPPTREGYTFAGWYKDEACTQVHAKLYPFNGLLNNSYAFAGSAWLGKTANVSFKKRHFFLSKS